MRMGKGKQRLKPSAGGGGGSGSGSGNRSGGGGASAEELRAASVSPSMILTPTKSVTAASTVATTTTAATTTTSSVSSASASPASSVAADIDTSANVSGISAHDETEDTDSTGSDNSDIERIGGGGGSRSSSSSRGGGSSSRGGGGGGGGVRADVGRTSTLSVRHSLASTAGVEEWMSAPIFARGFGAYLENGLFSDVRIVTDTHEYDCHRMLLAHHSGYLARLFDGNGNGNGVANTSAVAGDGAKVTNTGSDGDTMRVYTLQGELFASTMAAVLHAIYHGVDTVPLDPYGAIGLMKVADILGMPELRQRSVDCLLRRTVRDNVTAVLLRAIEHDVTIAVRHCIDVLAKNFNQLVREGSAVAAVLHAKRQQQQQVAAAATQHAFTSGTRRPLLRSESLPPPPSIFDLPLDVFTQLLRSSALVTNGEEAVYRAVKRYIALRNDNDGDDGGTDGGSGSGGAVAPDGKRRHHERLSAREQRNLYKCVRFPWLTYTQLEEAETDATVPRALLIEACLYKLQKHERVAADSDGGSSGSSGGGGGGGGGDAIGQIIIGGVGAFGGGDVGLSPRATAAATMPPNGGGGGGAAAVDTGSHHTDDNNTWSSGNSAAAAAAPVDVGGIYVHDHRSAIESLAKRARIAKELSSSPSPLQQQQQAIGGRHGGGDAAMDDRPLPTPDVAATPTLLRAVLQGSSAAVSPTAMAATAGAAVDADASSVATAVEREADAIRAQQQRQHQLLPQTPPPPPRTLRRQRTSTAERADRTLRMTPRATVNMSLTYTHDYDSNGVFYYIGTKGGTEEWTNPGLRGRVRATCSSIERGSITHVFELSPQQTWTKDVPSSWIAVNLGSSRYLVPTYYTLRHGEKTSADSLRNWALQATNDGRAWTTLQRSQNDESLNGPFASSSWPVECTHAYRMFRVLQTGHNSSSHNFLALSGFEMYGDLYETSGAKRPAYT